MQYDFVAGLDLSSLSSVSQTQIIQAINQLAPLLNIGGVIFQAGTSLNATIAQGTGGSPSVTNDPRFSRYIWLNTYSAASAPPTIYLYDTSTGNWTASTIAAGSITNTHISAAAAIAVTKLALGTARYLIRTNAAGNAVEYVAPASVNTVNEIPVNNLVANGSNGYLKTVSGAVAWVNDATERAAIQNAIANLAISALAAGANNTLIGTNGAGVVVSDSIGNILANGAIGLNLLAAGGSALHDVLYSTGTAWEKRTPAVNFLQGAAINSGTLSASTLAVAVHTFPHGLGAVVPKLVRAVIRCNSADNGYAAGDEVDIGAVRDNGLGNSNVITVVSDTTNVVVLVDVSGSDMEMQPKGGTTFANLVEANWNPKVYAWA